MTSAKSLGRRVRIALSMALVLASLGVLGYAGWQLYGTNYVSRHAQEQAVDDLQQSWSSQASLQVESRAVGGSVPETMASRTAAAAKPRPVSAPKPGFGTAYALVRIPRFGNDYEIPLLEGVRDQELATGFGHIPRTAQLGDTGNFAIAGHRVTHGEPLRDIPKLRPGDKVIVETRRATYTYELDTNPNELVVTFKDVWVIGPRPDNPVGTGVNPTRSSQRLLTLVTCSELFHTDNRMIAFGHLKSVEAKS
jgi:sortase A